MHRFIPLPSGIFYSTRIGLHALYCRHIWRTLSHRQMGLEKRHLKRRIAFAAGSFWAVNSRSRSSHCARATHSPTSGTSSRVRPLCVRAVCLAPTSWPAIARKRSRVPNFSTPKLPNRMAPTRFALELVHLSLCLLYISRVSCVLLIMHILYYIIPYI